MSADRIINAAVEILTNYRVNPLAAGSSSPVCRRCRLVDCLALCYRGVTCRAIDYDTGATSCYLLNSTNSCDTLAPASNVIHIAIAVCYSKQNYDSICSQNAALQIVARRKRMRDATPGNCFFVNAPSDVPWFWNFNPIARMLQTCILMYSEWWKWGFIRQFLIMIKIWHPTH